MDGFRVSTMNRTFNHVQSISSKIRLFIWAASVCLNSMRLDASIGIPLRRCSTDVTVVNSGTWLCMQCNASRHGNKSMTSNLRGRLVDNVAAEVCSTRQFYVIIDIDIDI